MNDKVSAQKKVQNLSSTQTFTQPTTTTKASTKITPSKNTKLVNYYNVWANWVARNRPELKGKFQNYMESIGYTYQPLYGVYSNSKWTYKIENNLLFRRPTWGNWWHLTNNI